jgi:aryl-alcohol dehydrogenase-like predicted oxidoreductase
VTVQIGTKSASKKGSVLKRFAAPAASLGRLGIDTIDVYYQHKDDPKVPLAESLQVFDALKRGEIQAVGLSQFTADRLDEAMTVAAAGVRAPVRISNRYNLVEREKLEALLDAAMGTVSGFFRSTRSRTGF